MNKPTKTASPIRVVLQAATAADLMTPNPASIAAEASVAQAAAFLTDNGFGAAPVMDAAGRPVGVVSRSDIVLRDRESIPSASRSFGHEAPASQGPCTITWTDIVDGDLMQVSDIMTPVVFTVTPQTPALKVIEEMLARKIHRLFVVDDNGILVGVISAVDVLRHLASGSDLFDVAAIDQVFADSATSLAARFLDGQPLGPAEPGEASGGGTAKA
jgi:CBS domain-containing protein